MTMIFIIHFNYYVQISNYESLFIWSYVKHDLISYQLLLNIYLLWTYIKNFFIFTLVYLLHNLSLFTISPYIFNKCFKSFSPVNSKSGLFKEISARKSCCPLAYYLSYRMGKYWNHIFSIYFRLETLASMCLYRFSYRS